MFNFAVLSASSLPRVLQKKNLVYILGRTAPTFISFSWTDSTVLPRRECKQKEPWCQAVLFSGNSSIYNIQTNKMRPLSPCIVGCCTIQKYCLALVLSEPTCKIHLLWGKRVNLFLKATFRYSALKMLRLVTIFFQKGAFIRATEDSKVNYWVKRVAKQKKSLAIVIYIGRFDMFD